MGLRNPSRHAFELATRVGAYPEPGMRRVALAAWLRRVDAETAALWMAEVVRRGGEGEPPFDRVIVAFQALLSDPDALGYEGLASIYSAARTLCLDDLGAMFMSSPAPAADDVRGQVIEAADGRPLTLGERKTLARRSSREQIARLLRDPNPTVLDQLLLNPRVTEKDVVLLAARRPTTGTIQQIVATSRRFSTRYAVRRALVLNPYSPSDLAVRLCALLSITDLRMVAAESSVLPPVRDAARKLLEKRLARRRQARDPED